MTVSEALLAASKGDVEAMDALGQYYWANEKVAESWTWFVKGAERNYPPSIVRAAIVGVVYAYSLTKAVGVDAEVAKTWEEVYRYSYIAICDPTTSEKDRTIINSDLPTTLYYLCYCYYCLRRYSDCIRYLNHPVGLSDTNCQVLLGLALLADETQDYIEKYYRVAQLLQGIDSIECTEDLVIYLAYSHLATIYRYGCPGVNKDLSLSYYYVSRAAQRAGIFAEDAQMELQKYRKRLFGGYTYQE